MKKIFYGILYCAIILTSSCKKAETTPTATSGTGKSHKDLKGLSVVNGVIIFSDLSTYQATVQTLDANQQSATAAFNATLPANATSDQVQAAATKQGYNENQPFLDFENSLSFHSMRMDFETAVLAWAANGLDDADPANPFTYYTSGNYAFLSTLNPSGAVGIGTELWKVMRNGVVYEITDGDFNTLGNITDANMDKAYTASNVVIHNPDMLGQHVKYLGGSCQHNKVTSNNFGPGAPHLQVFIEVHDYAFVNFKRTQDINWNKKGGSWYRDWALIDPKFGEDGDCDHFFNDCGGFVWVTYKTCTSYYRGTGQSGNLRATPVVVGGAWGSSQSAFTLVLQ